jgi:hypothetical protein
MLPNCHIIIVPPRSNPLIVTFSSRAGYYLPAKFTSIETSATCFSPPLPLSSPMETYALYRIDVICARPIGLVQAWILYAASCGSGEELTKTAPCRFLSTFISINTADPPPAVTTAIPNPNPSRTTPCAMLRRFFHIFGCQSPEWGTGIGEQCSSREFERLRWRSHSDVA